VHENVRTSVPTSPVEDGATRNQKRRETFEMPGHSEKRKMSWVSKFEL
jgi:hypothetical protein